MAATKRKPLLEPPQLYKGADTCDFVPEWSDTDPELLALLKTCHDADPDELTLQLVLADWLGEHDDSREMWVRVGCGLWAACRELGPGQAGWDYDRAKAALSPVCESWAGWKLSCLWGCLVAWHGPAGWGDKPMGRTWVDVRTHIVNRGVWWWTLGFLCDRQADAAGCQADAAGHQADAAGCQADAAGRQAYAAWYQAYAAGHQAYAAGCQAYAAGHQAYAAWYQAYAAGHQADAAWYQADAAGCQAEKRMWRWARKAWDLCVTKLPLLEGNT